MANGREADRAADAARLRRALATNPQDRVSWHNLAAAEGDLGHAAEAESAARRALALGIAAPETRLVLALALRPVYPEAHRDLAQLRWMRTGRVDDALAALDAALRKAPQEIYLHLVRSIALEFVGDKAGALAAVEAGLAHAAQEPQLLRQASHLCAELGEGARAVAFAQR